MNNENENNEKSLGAAMQSASCDISGLKSSTENGAKSVLSGYPHTIGELQELIKDLDPKKKLAGTWESTWSEVSIYEAKDGTVVIDLDEDLYKDAIASGDMLVDHSVLD